MEDYKSNSYKSRGENKENDVPTKHVKKVVTGSAKTKKKNEIQKFAEVFVAEDVDNVKNYILEDVIIPAIKNVLLDVVKTLLGFSGTDKSESKTPASRISYRSYYNKDSRDNYQLDYRQNGYDFASVVCDNKNDAETVLRGMDEIIEVYGSASVADLYELVGITGRYTDNNYGWNDIRSATIVRLRNNDYEIRMPKAFPLN